MKKFLAVTWWIVWNIGFWLTAWSGIHGSNRDLNLFEFVAWFLFFGALLSVLEVIFSTDERCYSRIGGQTIPSPLVIVVYAIGALIVAREGFLGYAVLLGITAILDQATVLQAREYVAKKQDKERGAN